MRPIDAGNAGVLRIITTPRYTRSSISCNGHCTGNPGMRRRKDSTNLSKHLRQYRLPMEESVPLFAALLALPVLADRYPPLHLSPQRQRRKTLESLVALQGELAARQPVLFILEDLHWTDPTTLDFLGLLMDHTPTASLSVLLTCRPEFQPPWHHRSYLTEITPSAAWRGSRLF